MSKETEQTGCLELLLGIPATLVIVVIATKVVGWIWGLVVAVASWIDQAVTRLFQWILAWPFFLGYLLLLGLLLAVALGITLVVAELVLDGLWPHQFQFGVDHASEQLQGRALLDGNEVLRLIAAKGCDAGQRTAAVRLLRCRPAADRVPERGIELIELPARTIRIEPTTAALSTRLRTIRQPVTVFLESLAREGLALLERDGVEAQAWQAVLDADDELQRLAVLRRTVAAMGQDVRQVLAFRADNELLSPTRQRSKELAPRLARDLERIDDRMGELRCFGYKLYEFLNIPRSLRSATLSDDIEDSLRSQRGLSDELVEDIALIEQTYGDLLGSTSRPDHPGPNALGS